MKYSSSSILLERAQRMKVNRIGKLFSSLKTIINGLFSCLSLKWSLIFNAISVFMQITCKQLIGLVYVWLFISLLPFSSYFPPEIWRWRRLFIHSSKRCWKCILKSGLYCKPLSRPQHCTNSQPIYSEWIRSSVHYNSPEFLLLIHVVWSFLCCSLLFTPGCSLHSAAQSLSVSL